MSDLCVCTSVFELFHLIFSSCPVEEEKWKFGYPAAGKGQASTNIKHYSASQHEKGKKNMEKTPIYLLDFFSIYIICKIFENYIIL